MTPKRIVFGERERFGPWALEQIGYPDSWGPEFETIGVESDGGILAAAVFTDYVPGVSISLHLAGKAGALWASPTFIASWFRFAFLQCRCRRVTATIAARNAKSRAFAEHIGFIYEGTVRHGLPDDDLRVYGILAEEASRWVV